MDPDFIYTPSPILVFQTWILGCTSISIPQDLLILTHLTHCHLIDTSQIIQMNHYPPYHHLTLGNFLESIATASMLTLSKSEMIWSS